MRLIALLLLALLAACTSRQPDVEMDRHVLLMDQRDVQAIQSLTDWSFRGRMAVNVENDPDASGQVNVRWKQVGEVSRVRLSGPLGAGAWEILWEPERVTVSDGDGEQALEYTGRSAADDFVREQLGFAFPANSIRYWVRGLWAPGGPDEIIMCGTYCEVGDIGAGRQYGWYLNWDRFDDFDGYVLPEKLRMTSDDVRLRIAISKWSVGSDN